MQIVRLLGNLHTDILSFVDVARNVHLLSNEPQPFSCQFFLAWDSKGNKRGLKKVATKYFC